MRFNIALSAMGCLCLILPVTAAEPDTEASPVLHYEPVLKQYQKFDQGFPAAPTQPHVGHDEPHASHALHQPASQQVGGQHDEHHHLHGE